MTQTLWRIFFYILQAVKNQMIGLHSFLGTTILIYAETILASLTSSEGKATKAFIQSVLLNGCDEATVTHGGDPETVYVGLGWII